MPIIGTFEPMFPLLTTDGEGFAHVCLLSRAELAVDNLQVLAYVTSRHTGENLRERSRATLMVVTPEAAFYCKLRVERHAEFMRGIVYCLRVESVKRDGIGVGLQSPRYWVDPSLPINERWAESAVALRLFAES
jgi:hypothetical protein